MTFCEQSSSVILPLTAFLLFNRRQKLRWNTLAKHFINRKTEEDVVLFLNVRIAFVF